MSADEQWTVPDGQHQPGPDASIGQNPYGPRPVDHRMIYDHWGVYKGDWRGHTVLCYNVSIMDYWLGPKSALDSHTVAIEVPVHCPRLILTPRTGLASVRRLLGAPGYGHGGFDRRFQVEADDADFARAVLTPEVTAWLAEHPVAVANPFRFEGSLLLMSNAGIMGPPEVVRPKLDFLVDLYHRVPARTWTPDT